MLASPEPLVTLRRYAAAAPWNGGELVRLVDRLLGAALQPPARPLSERTLHFYVAHGVVGPPSGRGAGTGWGYPHLIDLLAARLNQGEGDALATIASKRTRLSFDEREVFVATTMATALPAPDFGPPNAALAEQALQDSTAADWHDVPVARGVSLRFANGHPLLDDRRRLDAILDDLAREVAAPTQE